MCRAAPAAQSTIAAASTQYTTVTGPFEDEEDEATTKALHQAHRFVRGVAGATPQGARCVELRLKPQLKASLVLAAPVSDSCAHMRGESGRGRGSRFGRRSRCLPRCLRCLDLLCLPFVHQLLVLHFSRFPLRQLHLEVCLAHRVVGGVLHALGWPRLQGKLGLGDGPVNLGERRNDILIRIQQISRDGG